MARLNIAKDFLAAYVKLEKPVQRLVDNALGRFPFHTHAGLHLEKLQGSIDPRVRTIRINDFWRGIVLAPEDGDEYTLLTVLPHDKANRYAISKRFSVNQAFGVLEVRDQAAIDQLEPAIRNASRQTETRLFDHVKDSALIRLGIDAEVLPLVRNMVSEEHLAPMAKLLPEPQYNVLVAFAAGYDEEEVWQLLCDQLVDEKPEPGIDPADLTAAIHRTPDRFAPITGPEDLAEMLANPFALWRTFLHKRQENIAYRALYTGPALVTGGAGTGKTVTAVHRAAFLAEKLPPGEAPAILMTTFTNNLADALQDQLGQIIDDESVLSRIRVSTVNKVAYDIVRDAEGSPPDIIHDHAKTRLWHSAAKHIGEAVSGKFLESEWDQVIMAQDLADRDAYLACERKGRLKRLSVPRETVWEGIAHALDELKSTGQRLHLQVVADAVRILADRDRPPYLHVLVDEGQDLHPTQWRLLRNLVGHQPDDLFIVSDPNQRIYDNRVSLGSLGIKVQGRSKRLTVGYRTTQEILQWSVGVLNAQNVTGLDDEPDTLKGYQSSLHGRRPAVHPYPDRDAELDGLVQQVVGWLGQGIEAHAIGVATRTKAMRKTVRDALKKAGITTSGKSGVRVETMHGMKGLEFQCGAVIGVDQGAVPLPAAVTAVEEDPATHAQDTQRERCLLFVASTRARDALYVSHAGEPSPFIAS
ncbi:UvrD-helicase domain-containing protein [Amycolatopsis sp. NPDC058986]|uniref:UvrD-helicase domain-containing protein n=1 Tax=unclassified Amycolatopsis TaxID=2618356 RepID=UPI00366EE59E